MKTLVLTTTFFVGSLLSIAARADFVYEPFDYPGGRDSQPLVGQTGGTGFAEAWKADAGWSTFFTHDSTLSFGDLSVSGNSVYIGSIEKVSGVVRTTVQNFMGAGIGTRFLSFLVQKHFSSNAFGGLYIDGSSGDLFLGKGGQYATWGMENRGGAGAVTSNVLAEWGNTALLVLKMESFAIGNDRFTLYINPTPGQSEPGFGLVKSDLDVGEANKIAIFTDGGYTFDEIRIGDSFAAVTPIASTPEPSTLVLSILGLSPVLATRMRKKFFKGRKSSAAPC